MQKKFFSNLILMIALNLLVKPFAIFGIDAAVQNRVGTENYGLYFTLLNLSFIFNILMDLGINNYTTKNVAQHPKIVARYISKIFSFRLILFLLYVFVTFTFAVSIGYEGKALYLLSLLVFNQLLVVMIAYFRSHFGGFHLFKIDAIISVLDRFLLIFICAWHLFFSDRNDVITIEWFIWMQTIAYGATFMIAFVLLIQKIGVPKFKFNWIFSLAVLRQSYPYALLILLMMIYTRTDAIMIERIHPNGKHEAGVYAQGFRLLDAFFMFGMIFANLLLPLFSRALKKDRFGILDLLNASRNLLIGGAIIIAFICSMNAEFLLSLIYSNNVAESVTSFQWLIWSFIGMCLSLVYGTLLTANGDMKFLNRLSLFGILINIIFNGLLIPDYGAAGSAFATLVTQSLIALAQVVFVHRKFKINFTFLQVTRYIGFVLSLIFASFFTPEKYLLAVQLTVGFTAIFVFKLIDVKSIKIAFTSEK